MKYAIVVIREGVEIPYFDPFTGKEFRDIGKLSAQKIALMLSLQHGETYEVREVKN